MVEQYGYAGDILKVDLSSGSITHLPTMDYSDRFLGGRGIAAKLYWDQVSPEVQAFDPKNLLIMITGPLAGFPGLAGSRWQVCGKSPATIPQHFSYCNMGGSWGAELKFAGYDGLVIEGKSDGPVYVFIEDDTIEIKDASHLWGKGAIETRNSLKGELGSSARVLAIGPAGENMVVFANLLADDDSTGSNGLGAVMGAKNLKAVVVRGSKKVKAADPETLREITKFLRELKQNQPWQVSTRLSGGAETKRDACWGCIKGCMRGIFTAKDGKSGKFFCGSAGLYGRLAQSYYGERSDEVAFKATKLCDEYGVDTSVITALIPWLGKCREAGILTDASTDIPLSKIGSLEFIESLVKKTSLRQGFGDILAQGPIKAADLVGSQAKELLAGSVSKTGEAVSYEPRMYITTAFVYAMEPRRSIQQLHAITMPVGLWLLWRSRQHLGYVSTDVLRGIGKRFFGGELAMDFSTYEGKALAAKKLQDREYAKESLILCDVIWPFTEFEETEDHVGDPTLESRILSAVTGKNVDEEGLHRIGERIWNLQRAVLVREGHKGRESDTLPEFFFTEPLETTGDNPKCLVPGKGGEVISRKGMVVDKPKFEQMKDEYYQLRGWDVATGFQTRAKLEELGLQDIASGLKQRGLIV